MSDSLRDIINEAMAANEDPSPDNLEATEMEDTGTETVDDEILEEAFEADDEDETLESEDESEDESEEDGETYEVRIDGEVVKVTLEEALAGYQRQADYTRKAQALANERQELESAREELSEVIEQVSSLDEAWGENPVTVLAHFAASTDNPTQAVALLIKELASADLLDRDFLEMFGITPEVRDEWSRESELEELRSRVNRSEQEESSKAAKAEQEAAVQRAIVQFDRDIDDIIENEGLSLSGAQRSQFRQKLAAYARDNELTNLKAAYKALKYEEESQKRKVAQKTAERAKAKRSASVVGRGSSAGSGANPVANEQTDLRSLITATMKELGA